MRDVDGSLLKARKLPDGREHIEVERPVITNEVTGAEMVDTIGGLNVYIRRNNA